MRIQLHGVGFYLTEAQNLVVLDELLITVVANHDTIKLGASLAGVRAILVLASSDEERVTFRLVAAFDGGVLEFIGQTVNFDPFDFLLVTDENLVFIKLELFAVVGNDTALAGDGAGLANMDATLDHNTGDVEFLTIDFTTHNGVWRDLLALDIDPGSWATGSTAVELFGALLALYNPVTESPGFSLFLLLALLMMFVSPETGATSEERGTSSESTTFQEIIFSISVDVEPVGLRFVLLRLVLGVVVISALLLASLLLAVTLLLTTLLLTALGLTIALLLAALLLTVASTLLLAITLLLTALRLTITLLLTALGLTVTLLLAALGLTIALLLAALLLTIASSLLLAITSLLLALLLSIASSLLLTMAAMTIMRCTIVSGANAAPEGGSDIGSPIRLRPVRLDDIVL